jgi:hypothetical protein
LPFAEHLLKEYDLPRLKLLHYDWGCFWLVFGLAFLFIFGLQIYYSPFAEDGLYFQPWAGDIMMQTLPAVHLKNAPIMSLFYLHIQPPMLDTLRAVVAWFSPSAQQSEVARFVDQGMYFVGMGLFSLLAALIFRWVSIATNSKVFGFIAALIWIPAPAALAMATLLEGTLLSSLAISWMLYQTWLYTQNRGNPYYLGLSAGLAFLTRTVIQWFFFPVFAVMVVLLGLKKKDAAIALSILGVIMLLLCGKQYLLFATLSTTTFSGQHKTGVIWYKPSEAEVTKHGSSIKVKYPPHAEKYTAGPLDIEVMNYNTENQWRLNLIHDSIFADRIKKHPIESLQGLIRSLWYNFKLYWTATSIYNVNHLVERLPWRKAYEWVFSHSKLVLLLFVSFSIWLVLLINHRPIPLRQSIGFALPVLYILAVSYMCNRLDWSEANRLKFFLEPSFFVFISTQFTLLFKWVKVSRLQWKGSGSLQINNASDPK